MAMTMSRLSEVEEKGNRNSRTGNGSTVVKKYAQYAAKSRGVKEALDEHKEATKEGKSSTCCIF